MTKADAVYPPPIVGWTGVGLLFLLYTFSYVDRSVLALLVDPIQHSLQIGDVEFSLLIGAAFSVFYAVIGIPIARLTDVGNRRLLIIAGGLLWASCTLLSGFAGSFAILVALRIGLAVGESVLSPASYSLIGDWFPKNKRTLPSSVYAWAGGIGASAAKIAVALVVGLVVEQKLLAAVPLVRRFEPWQLIFFIVGIPTIMAIGIFALLVKEPRRVGVDPALRQAPPIGEVASYLRTHWRLYAGMLLGGGLGTIGYAAFGSWGPQLLKRNYGWMISDAGMAIGVMLGLSSIVGYVLLPRLSEWARDRADRPDLAVIIAMVLSAGGCTLMAVAPLAPNAELFLLLWGLGNPLVVATALLALTSIPVIAPPQMRGVIASVYLMVSALAQTVGPLCPALFAQYLFVEKGPLALAWGITATVAVTPIVSVSLLALSRRPYGEAIKSQLGIGTR